ncbi:phosphotransferase family protein [Pseudonocardia sp. TRM90224]|uniref:phosphotransferase family protein n=1 Tax=Pseudonocardia sp. TRM90224 TaxID=2812678 RepID=UPI001E648166|nr:phosphotransferase [Pseudonocardia sp. TRM90224]
MTDEQMIIEQGWDSITTLVDGRWIERRPRRPEIAANLVMETRVLPWLAPGLPLAVPVPVVAQEEPLVVRHPLVVGQHITRLDAANGTALGTFLRALHAADVEQAVVLGLRPGPAARAETAATTARFRERVVPLLPAYRRAAGLTLLEQVGRQPADTVVHGDLGPEHVLCADGVLSGVIDFTDAHVGDAALDLAWPLHGTPAAFADAVATAYGGPPDLRGRALLWHRLGPWYEVEHGLETGDDEDVRSGLAGVLDRLS